MTTTKKLRPGKDNQNFATTAETQRQIAELKKKWGENTSATIRRAISIAYASEIKGGAK